MLAAMSKSIALSLVFILGCVAGATTAQLVVPKAHAGTNPQRWEYHCVSEPDDWKSSPPASLNALGAEGWEMVAAGTPNQFARDARYCFKRPLG
jgi:hypothetical protein